MAALAAQPASSGAGAGPRFQHRLNYQQHIETETPSTAAFQTSQDAELVRRQLDRALALALDAVGFDEADPLAMECFRNVVEAYMRRFLLSVHRSMVAARRRTPVPLDFQAGLSDNNLTLRSLLPHLDPPVHSSTTSRHPVLSSRDAVLPTLHPTTTISSSFGASAASAAQDALLSQILSGSPLPTMNGTSQPNGLTPSSSQHRPQYIPPSLPALPSRHTYRSSVTAPARRADAQSVRERATEEGRLGEEALRRLAATQAELRKAREEREEREAREGAGMGGLANGMDVDDDEMDGMALRLRKRKATGTGTGPARNLAAEPRGVVVFRGRVDDIYKGLMVGIGAGAGMEAGGATAGTTDEGVKTGGTQQLVASVQGVRDKPGGWNGGLNEPINAERAYWRQTAKKGAASG